MGGFLTVELLSGPSLGYKTRTSTLDNNRWQCVCMYVCSQPPFLSKLGTRLVGWLVVLSLVCLGLTDGRSSLADPVNHRVENEMFVGHCFIVQQDGLSSLRLPWGPLVSCFIPYRLALLQAVKQDTDTFLWCQ